MDDRIRVNQRRWDEYAAIHAAGAYPVQDFIDGKRDHTCRQLPDNIGDVAGKSMLHLQCHIGLDTLSFAHRGAKVTGVDFSPRALREARGIADASGLEARFVESDIASLPERLNGGFDIVITYYGTITWLPDLRSWARTIAHFLKPGAFFYIADTHPFVQIFEQTPAASPRPYYDYCAREGRPERFESSGSYADLNAATRHNLTYEWLHSIQDVVCSLIDAGLQIAYFHEFPFMFYNMFPQDPPVMKQVEGGWWRMVENPDRIPLMFSLKAVKPATALARATHLTSTQTG